MMNSKIIVCLVLTIGAVCFAIRLVSVDDELSKSDRNISVESTIGVRQVMSKLGTPTHLSEFARQESGESASEEIDSEESAALFRSVVKPLLSDRCFKCHGPDEGFREADLRLDQPDQLFEPFGNGEAFVVPGDIEKSELYRRITTDDPYERMPPEDSNLSLSPSEIESIAEWIESGAKWDQHWSYTPLMAVDPPDVSNERWSQNPIDRFILRGIEQNGLEPNERAMRSRLARRLYFDLTGLPPSHEELQSFLNDSSDSAYETLIDDLLGRESFGEHFASDWLDVARYSDSYGYQVDRDRFVWPWRDWVIRSLNDNLSFDEFISWQVAGDLLDEPTRDQRIATTFSRLHSQKVEGGSVPEEFRNEYVADRVQTVAMAFLGITLECARCHDHKYDPISQREYYQLYAFFNNIDEAGLYSYFTNSIPTPTLLLTDEATDARIASAKAKLDQLRQESLDVTNEQWASFRAWVTDLTETEAEENEPHDLEAIRHYSFEEGIAAPNRQVIGISGNAIELTGDDGFATDVGNFRRSQPFSISCWLRVSDHKDRAVVFHRSRAWTDAASRGYELLLIDGRLQWSLIHFWPGNAISIQASDAVTLGEWVHVCVTYDGSSEANGLGLFVNGEAAETTVVRDHLIKNITGGGGDNIAIGQRFRDRGLANGSVDEFFVFDRQLTPIEVRALSNGSTETNLPELADGVAEQLSEFDSIEAAVGSTGAEANDWRELFEFYQQRIDQVAQEKRASLQQARLELNDIINATSELMVMEDMDQRRPTHILHRGAYDSPLDEVEPATPASFPPFAADSPTNRLGLAQWLTGNASPMVSRVIVNHYWQLIFGQGLVRTPEDFGSQGSPPTHPELLDFLAADFVDHGWDLKRLIKLMVLSETYRQSGDSTDAERNLDPENLWLARGPRQRLTAEMMRDQVLALSGLLVTKMGGPPVRPYQVTESFKPVAHDSGEGLYRRSVYTFWKRTGPAPVMMVMDASKRDVCSVQRERTNTPLQSIVLLNDPQLIEASRHLAGRLLTEFGENPEGMAQRVFELLTSRTPDEFEIRVIVSMVEQQAEAYASQPAEANALLNVGESEVDSSLEPINLAAWTLVVSTLFSHEECVTKY